MEYVTSTLIYILSVFLCRYSFRMQYKWGFWGKDSCRFSGLWIIPVVNTIIGIITISCGFCAKIENNAKFKNKSLKWFTNSDL